MRSLIYLLETSTVYLFSDLEFYRLLISLEIMDICKITVFIFIFRIKQKQVTKVYLVSAVPQHPTEKNSA